MNLYEPIPQRKSTRSYLEEALGPTILKKIEGKIEKINLLNDRSLYVIIKDGNAVVENIKGIIGNYGKIKAPHYIVLCSREDEESLLNLGFVGERLVLFLTREEIGSCWIGKFGNKRKIKNKIEIDSKFIPQALIAFGNTADDPLRKKTPKRKELSDLIIKGEPDSLLRDILGAVRLAPSAVNLQPWRFGIVKDSGVIFYLNKKGIVKKVFDKVGDLKRLNYIDMGIALRHAEIASNELAKGCKIEDFDETQAKIKGYDPIKKLSIDR